MNRIAQALIELAEALQAYGKGALADHESSRASAAVHNDCEACEAFGIDLHDLTDWRDDLEIGVTVPRTSVESYAEDVAQATILNASTIARIGRKWGFGVE
jgi:hypothetical protein